MGATILIIDAEPVVRSVMTRILEKEGHTVRATGDVEEALRMVETSVPDPLLTNVFLPAMPGHEVALLLKSVHPGIPVLMVAGLPDDRQIYDRTTGSGIEQFPKPFTARAFTDKINEVLNRNSTKTGFSK